MYYHQWTRNGRSKTKQKKNNSKAKKWRDEITLNICVHLNESFESIQPTYNPKSQAYNERSWYLDVLCAKKMEKMKKNKGKSIRTHFPSISVFNTICFGWHSLCVRLQFSNTCFTTLRYGIVLLSYPVYITE